MYTQRAGDKGRGFASGKEDHLKTVSQGSRTVQREGL